MANEKLGIGLKNVRIREGFTQVELASNIGTTQGYVNQMENGNISMNKFAEILAALGYTFEINIIKLKGEEVHV
jgi:transcriptional regulator with XRE-family HTH domain